MSAATTQSTDAKAQSYESLVRNPTFVDPKEFHTTTGAAKSDTALAREMLIAKIEGAYKNAPAVELECMKAIGAEALKYMPIETMLTENYKAAKKAGIPEEFCSILTDMIAPTWNNSLIPDDASRLFMAIMLNTMLEEVNTRAHNTVVEEKLKAVIGMSSVVRICNNPACTDPSCPNKSATSGPLGIHDMMNCKVKGCSTCGTAPIPYENGVPKK